MAYKKTEEHKKKISNTLKRLCAEGKIKPYYSNGERMKDETKKKLSLFRIGKSYEEIYGKEEAEKIKRKIGKAQIGKHPSKETRKKLGAWQMVEKNPNWKDGKFIKNEKLREETRKRDGYRCQECFRHQNELKKKLDIHHIDFNKKNNNPFNLITLCHSCHAKTDYRKKDDWINYFRNVNIERGLTW